MQKHFVNPGFNARKNLRLVFIVTTILLILAAIKIYQDVFAANVSMKYSSGKEYVYVSSNRDYDKMLAYLKKNYILENQESFERLAELIDLRSKLKPGRYPLSRGMNNFQLMRLISSGAQEPVNVVLKYAERKSDVASFFGKQLEADSLMLLNMLNDTQVVARLGFDTNTVLTIFIPNTYNFFWNTSASGVLERMKKEYSKFWTQDRIAKAFDCGLTQSEVSILASIVQKESNKSDEMPVIAGVYLNRLRKGIPLQADPTVIYAWNDKSIRRVTHLHTAINSSYNTYMNAGLPPGPICIPSITAIDAVLNYDHNEYIYFCAREDFSGYHSFAKSLEQHNQNARRYQRALNQLNIR